MTLLNFLSEKRSVILNRWYDSILNSYPAETARFLKSQKNPFLNPVGSTTYKSLEGLYDYLCRKAEEDKVSQFLDSIVRIRAVQEFTPSQSIRFILSLKAVIREELKEEIGAHGLHAELREFEQKIDDLSLLAFDIYMKCREKLYQLKVNELQGMTYRRLQKADEVYKKEYAYDDIHNEQIEIERKEVAK